VPARRLGSALVAAAHQDYDIPASLAALEEEVDAGNPAAGCELRAAKRALISVKALCVTAVEGRCLVSRLSLHSRNGVGPGSVPSG
jgi:hypothetical protein